MGAVVACLATEHCGAMQQLVQQEDWRQAAEVLLEKTMSDGKNFNHASSTYERGEFKLAFESFRDLAMEGDVDAMSMLATMYGSGEGVQYDFDQSVAWARKAAELGNYSSFINLGIAYRAKGDLRAAKAWFQKAFDVGDGEAALELAKLYLVSELETERVRQYLESAVAMGNLCEQSEEEVQSLLRELSMRGQ